MFFLSILGGAVLEGSSGIVRGKASHRRRLALLAILALARGRALRREKLIGLLWPEHSGDAARRLLSESLYVLKKELGDDVFVVVGDEVALNQERVRSDVDEFEKALAAGDYIRATELYRGPLLDGFYVTEADEFERWVEGERDRLDHAYERALEQAAEGYESSGDFLGAVGWWRRRAAHDPYSSRVVLRLMRALELAGEHLAAIRVAAEYAEMLARLDAAPDPEVLAYAERLRTAPPSGRLPPRPVPASPQSAESAAPPPAANLPPSRDAAHERSGSVSEPRAVKAPLIRQRSAVALAIFTAAVGLIVLAWLRLGQRPAAAAEPPLDPRRIAVLYFDDHSPGRKLEYLAAILTEDLIDKLNQADSLDVVSRNGVKPFREQSIGVDSIARSLRAGTVIEGSIWESQGRVRVNVRMIDMAHGGKSRSRTVERSKGELFSLEDGLGGEVSHFLLLQVGRDIRIRQLAAETRNGRARELVYRAQLLMEQATRPPAPGIRPDTLATLRTLRAADSLLSLASAQDGRWTRPILLHGWVTLRRCQVIPEPERAPCYARAVAAAEAALRMRPGEARAFELRGTAHWWSVSRRASDPAAHDTKVAAAIRDLGMAVTADPSLARGWATLSQALRIAGRAADADRAARRALAEDEYLEEASLVIERLYRSSLYLARYDTAGAWCERGARQFPNDYRFMECRLALLGFDGAGRPDLQRARSLYRELVQLDPPTASHADGRAYTPLYRIMAVAKVAARAGRRDTAEILIRQVRGQAGEDPALRLSFALDEAHVRLLLGQRDSVFPLLDYFLHGRPHDRGVIAQDARFRSLHGDPRFNALVGRSGSTD